MCIQLRTPINQLDRQYSSKCGGMPIQLNTNSIMKFYNLLLIVNH